VVRCPWGGRGRTLGFPTANVKTERPLGPPVGVYVCRLLAGARQHQAVVNVGYRPTFGETDLSVEAHVLILPATSTIRG
jgi:riboflavin kinase/FMN adenylyltransferase